MARETLPQSLMHEPRCDRGRHAAKLLRRDETSGNIRVCLIEGHAIVRAGLRMLLEREDRVEVVCEASSGPEALSSALRWKPDIVLFDVGVHGNDDLDFLPVIVDALSPARVLVLTAIEDADAHLLAMKKGACGVVMLTQGPEILVRAIQAVNSGESWIGQAVSSAAIAKLSRMRVLDERANPEGEKIALLTPREREIVGIVAQGYNGARIAAELGISEATVRHHITSILAKLELSNKLELAVYAFHNHLGPSPHFSRE